MIKQLRDKIKEKLNTLTGSWQPLSVVYNYPTLDIQWYPCVMIDFDKSVGEYSDTCNNKRTYNFVIYIMQEIKVTDRFDATDSVEDIMVKIMNLFDRDTELWGIVNNIKAVWWWVAEYTGWSDWRYMWGIVTLEIETIYSLQ